MSFAVLWSPKKDGSRVVDKTKMSTKTHTRNLKNSSFCTS